MDERAVLQRLMKKQVEPGELRDQLRALKLRATYGNGILFQMVKKAAEGDLTAAKYILGAIKEDPAAACVGPDLSEIPTEDLRKLLEG